MEKKLQRNQQDKMIAGVCSGLAEHFDIDVTWIRIAFVLAVMLGASGILAYIILWIVVPKKPYMPDFGQYGSYNSVNSVPNPPIDLIEKKKEKSNFRLIAGLTFIFFGLFFLLNELNLIPDWLDFDDLWPLILIVMGFYILTSGFNRNQKAVADTPRGESNEVQIEPEVLESESIDPINSSADHTTEKPL